MSDEITPELFAHLVQLAALELSPEESEYLRAQLNGQLRAIRELERIEIPGDVPPAAHGVSFGPGLRPPARGDQTRPPEETERLAQKILAQAPEVDEGYFVVPDIPHEEL